MIVEKQELKLNSLISLRKNMTQQEIPSEMTKLQLYLKSVGANKVGPSISTTFNVVQAVIPIMDMEILIPIDKEIGGTPEYKVKKEFLITNAIKIIHKGNPMMLQNTINEINAYMQLNNLQPITSAYNVAIQDAKDLSDIDNVEIHIYVGINPNKL
ncbi:transcriptional regulator [Clostridium sp.]|uniref:transcriptional regulator n=1 Tax=Clostridium sp. TaxID=1506 RepID=UPI003D6CB8E1